MLRRARVHVLALLVGSSAIGSTLLADRSLGQPREEAQAARDVTAFGLLAEPGRDRIDPMLSPYSGPLRKLVPGHGLTLLESATGRLGPNESIEADLGHGRTLRVTLDTPLDPDGKVHLRVQLLDAGRSRPVFVTEVRTPADQLVFLDKALPDSDARLLIGVGAR